MKVQSSETFKMFFVIPRAVQSLSRYPLISCYFPKPNIKFPPWSESNKSPRRELAVLMEKKKKKPEVKIRSGHLSPLAVLAPRAPGWARPALRRPEAVGSLRPHWETVQNSGVLVIVVDVVVFTLFAFLFSFCPHRNRCGCFSLLVILYLRIILI